MKTKWICAKCGLPAVPYYYGWKHHPGGGRKVPWPHRAVPVEVQRRIR